MSEDRVRVTRMTPGTGHVEAALPLEAIGAFVDEEVRQGRCVVAEVGDESFIGRVGRAVVDWFRARRGADGKPKAEERVTALPPMAGGSGPPAMAMQRRYEATLGAQSQPFTPSASLGTNPQAWSRSWDALVEHVGESRATALMHGGGISSKSTFWPEVFYIITSERVKVIGWGIQICTLCLQTTDGSPPWDRVLAILTMLDAGAEGETEMWAKANSM